MVEARRNDSSSGLVYDTSVAADRVYEFKYIGGDIAPGQTQPVSRTLFARSREGVVLPDQRIVFADQNDNTIVGTGNKLGDHLYGGAGADTLSGEGATTTSKATRGDDCSTAARATTPWSAAPASTPTASPPTAAATP